MNPYEPCTQAEFGALIGVTQQAVSDMIERGVLTRGMPLGNWLRDAFEHLRDQAAGRDNELATERAKETKVRRELGEIALAKARKEVVPVPAFEMVLAHMGRAVAGLLEPLPGELSKLNPNLTPEDVALIQARVSDACNLASSASLEMLNEPDEAATEPDEVEPIAGEDDEVFP